MGKCVDAGSISYLMLRRDLLGCGFHSLAYTFGALYCIRRMIKRKRVSCSYKLLMDITRLSKWAVRQSLDDLVYVGEISRVSGGSGKGLVFELKSKQEWLRYGTLVVDPHMLDQLAHYKRARHGLVATHYMIKSYCDIPWEEGGTGTCFASQNTLAEKLGLGVRTLRDQLPILMQESFVREVGWGPHWTKRYTVYDRTPTIARFPKETVTSEQLAETKQILSGYGG